MTCRGGRCWETKAPFQPKCHPLECHPDPKSSSGQAGEPASAIQDPEQAGAPQATAAGYRSRPWFVSWCPIRTLQHSPATWILNQVQDNVSGGRCWETKAPFQPKCLPAERHPDPKSSSGQASEPASAIQDPEQASAARGPASAVPRSGQYVDDPVNNKSRLQPVINDYHYLELCA